MRYAALLRGVNVGGNGTVDMPSLRDAVTAAGMTNVRTYINSGNMVFESEVADTAQLTETIETAIERRFGFRVRVLVKTHDGIASIASALPADWKNDKTMKCDVYYLWPEVDDPAVLQKLEWDPAVDDVRYTPGAVLRCAPTSVSAKTKLTKVIGTPLYRQMTVRNCNTARKLLAMLEE